MKKYNYIIIFLILSLLTIFTFQKWYIFQLDFLSVPKSYIYYDYNFYDYFTWLFFNWITYFIPSWIFQRLVYIITLFLLWVWWYKLLESKSKTWAYFAWIFMMFNPFIYARFMDWQIWVVLSILMLLFFFYFLIKHLNLWLKNKSNLYNIFIFSLFGSLSIMWMIHSVYFIIWSLIIFLWVSYFNIKNLKFIIKTFLISLSIILLLNINLIIWLFLWNSSIKQTLWQISESHYNVFYTDKWQTNLYFNTLTLHGYWGERYGRFLPTYFDNSRWIYLFLLIFGIILFWIYFRFTDKKYNNKYIDYSFMIIWIISYILALGIAYDNIFSPINRFLYDYFPFYNWMREPHKWLWLLLIVYIYFWWIWVSKIYDYIKNNIYFMKDIFTLFIVILPILYTPTMMFWFFWQLKVSDYPVERYDLNDEFWKMNLKWKNIECEYKKSLKSEKCYDVLSLPWHQYLWTSFAWKIISNPSQWFFYNVKILQWDNMEIWAIYTQSVRLESKIIEKYIWSNWKLRNLEWDSVDDMIYFINDLRWLWIQYILLLKESDRQTYRWFLNLMEKENLIKIQKNNDKLILYKLNIEKIK